MSHPRTTAVVVYWRSLVDFAHDVLVALLPEDFDDDLMAVAEAAGATPDTQPVPYALTALGEQLLAHRAISEAVEQIAAVRASTPAGARDFEAWARELEVQS